MKLRNVLKNYEISPKEKKNIYTVTLLTALFILALSLKEKAVLNKYIFNDSGNVIAIERENTQKPESYEFILSVVSEEGAEKRSVTINKQSVSDIKKQDTDYAEENRAIERESEISNIITNIEVTEDSRLVLPDRLSDGTRLYWSLKEEGIGNYFLTFIVYIALVLLIIKSNRKNDNEALINKRKNILNNLPRFTNQLLMMMNSGMILSDAFNRICKSYELINDDGIDSFQKDMIKIYKNNEDHRASTASLIHEYAGKNNVKEMIRISTLLIENEKRGSDIVDNLERESIYLWDERKIIARECGKMIDTKMAYPMGLMLMVLIVITMAPAVINL